MSILENVHFSGKGRQSLIHVYTVFMLIERVIQLLQESSIPEIV